MWGFPEEEAEGNGLASSAWVPGMVALHFPAAEVAHVAI